MLDNSIQVSASDSRTIETVSMFSVEYNDRQIKLRALLQMSQSSSRSVVKAAMVVDAGDSSVVLSKDKRTMVEKVY